MSKPDPKEEKPSKAEQIRSTLYDTRWTSCVLKLSNGEELVVPHRDYVFIPPESLFLLYVRVNRFRVIFIDQIVSVEVDIDVRRPATK